MKSLLISDLHKRKGKYSDFFITDKKLYNQLLYWLDKFDNIVIGGDCWEMWYGRWPTEKCAVEEFEKTLKDFPLSSRLILEHENIFIVSGNHDKLMYKIIRKNTDKVIISNLLIEDLYIAHGHFDFINKKLPKFAYFIAWFSKTLLKPIFGKNFENRLAQIIHGLGIDFFNQRKQLKKAKEICKKTKATKVIFGHTHRRRIVPFYIKDKKCYLINMGRYHIEFGDFTIVDTDIGEIIQNKISFKSDIDRVRKKLKKKGKIVSTLGVNDISSQGIKFATGTVSHISITEGHGRILEQIASGLQSSPIHKYLDGEHNVVIQDFYDRSKVNEIIKYIHKRIGKKYAFFQIVVDGIYILVNLFTGADLRKSIKYDFAPGKTKCNEEVARAIFMKMNERIKPGVISANTWPQDFLDNTSLLYKEIEYFV